MLARLSLAGALAKDAFVRAIYAVFFTVADVGGGQTLAMVLAEELALLCLAITFAKCLVKSIVAVLSAITFPADGKASSGVIAASERSLDAFHPQALITLITAVWTVRGAVAFPRFGDT